MVAPPPEWSHAALWSGVPEDIAETRRFVADHLAEHQLSRLVGDAQLVVSELATNAVMHAGTPFSVTMSRFDHGVEIAVGDGAWAETPRFRTSTFGLGGRGLYVVSQLSKDWGVRPEIGGGKSVWAILAI